MKASPLTLVKDRFGDKEKLVSALQALATDDLWVSRVSDDKGFSCISNAKLLRLHGVLSSVKEKFGTRAKLIDAILEAEKRSKDEGYRTRLERHPTPRLWDHLGSATKAAKS